MTDPVVLSLLDQPDEDPQRRVELTLPVPDGWPLPPAQAAYHGLAGEIVQKIAPETEADPVAILSQLLVLLRCRGRPRRMVPGRSDPSSPQRVSRVDR